MRIKELRYKEVKGRFFKRQIHIARMKNDGIWRWASNNKITEGLKYDDWFECNEKGEKLSFQPQNIEDFKGCYIENTAEAREIIELNLWPWYSDTTKEHTGKFIEIYEDEDKDNALSALILFHNHHIGPKYSKTKLEIKDERFIKTSEEKTVTEEDVYIKYWSDIYRERKEVWVAKIKLGEGQNFTPWKLATDPAELEYIKNYKCFLTESGAKNWMKKQKEERQERKEEAEKERRRSLDFLNCKKRITHGKTVTYDDNVIPEFKTRDEECEYVLEQQKLTKEPIMATPLDRDEILAALCQKTPVAPKEKTDLEKRLPITGRVFNENGSLFAVENFKSKKKARRHMQLPKNLGKTMVISAEVEAITTHIPIVKVK